MPTKRIVAKKGVAKTAPQPKTAPGAFLDDEVQAALKTLKSLATKATLEGMAR